MKKFLILCVSMCFMSSIVLSEEDFSQKTEQPAPPKDVPKAPFNLMTQAEQAATGIKKLTQSEQEALIKWWTEQKNHPQPHISKEVSLSAVQEEGKYLVLSDGTRLSLAKSNRKKIKKWAVGDKIGIGEPGRRGTLTIYHMATGRKVKARRDQAPEKSSEKSSGKQKS